jgi:hypothetical protein
MLLKASVSGSFHRHMPAIYDAVGELRSLGVNVLSPSDPRVVDHLGDFLFVASDKLRSIKLVEDRHLEAIRASNFLWVVCPDGYTGPSTCGEIMAAYVLGVPVFADSPALDVTIGQYVKRVRSMRLLVETMSARHKIELDASHILIDPDHAIQRSIGTLEQLRPALLGLQGNKRADPERKLENARRLLWSTFGINR